MKPYTFSGWKPPPTPPQGGEGKAPKESNRRKGKKPPSYSPMVR